MSSFWTHSLTYLGGAHKRLVRSSSPSFPPLIQTVATAPPSTHHHPPPRRLMRASVVVFVCLSVPSLLPNPRNHNFAVCGDTLKARATSVRSREGIVLEDGSGVAVDWDTGRSYSSARRRRDVQSGQRKGG